MKPFLKITALSFLIAITYSCTSKKIAASANSTEITLPISNFDSDKNFIRSVSSGTSPNMAFAKELAFKNAANEIAKTINTKVKSVLEDYAKQSEIQSSIDFRSETERMVTISVDQSLKNLKIVKEKIFQNQDKNYTYWVGVELSKEDVYNSLSNKISASKIKALHEDKVNFRETFDKNFEEK